MSESDSCEVQGPSDNEVFGKSAGTDDADNTLIDEQKSKNSHTLSSTRWSVAVFEGWRTSRMWAGEIIPSLRDCDINEHLSRFVVEVRKQNGEVYPPRSLYNIACGLLRKLRDEGDFSKNFLDDKDSRFAHFRCVLDTQMKKLTEEGLGIVQREAKLISAEDEQLLWSKGVLGRGSSSALQYMVYFYNCKLFGIRGSAEHRELKTSQFEIGCDEIGNFIEYKATNLKYFNGGLRQGFEEPKVIRHYDEASGIVSYYEEYLSALASPGYFYRRPLPKLSGRVRYSEQVVGINKLKTFMKDMCSQAGLMGRYTTHLSKKTCAARLDS